MPRIVEPLLGYLWPARKGRVIAVPFHKDEKDRRTPETLKSVAGFYNNTYSPSEDQKLKPEDLYCTFVIKRFSWPTNEPPKEASARLTLWEMDFGREQRKDVQLAQIGGRLVRLGDNRWNFWFDESAFRAPPPNPHSLYLRVTSPTQQERGYVLVPLNPAEVGYASQEGNRFEISFRLDVKLVGDGNDDGEVGTPLLYEGETPWERSRRAHSDWFWYPMWWRQYRSGSKKGNLPVMHAAYRKFKLVGDKDVMAALNTWYQEFRLWAIDRREQQRAAVSAFATLPDDIQKFKRRPLKPPRGPIVWGATKILFKAALQLMPAVEALGITVDFIENFRTLANQTRSNVIDTRAQIESEYGKLIDFGAPLVKAVKGVVTTLDPSKPESPDLDGPVQRLSDFVRELEFQVAKSWQEQHLVATQFYASIEKKVKTLVADRDQGLLQQLKTDLDAKADVLRKKSMKVPKLEEMLGALWVQYLNQYQIGVYTWSTTFDELKQYARQGGDSGEMLSEFVYEGNQKLLSHSHVAAQNRYLERHVYHGLRKFPNGVFKSGDRLYISKAAQQNHLPGLEIFVEFKGARNMLNHFRRPPTGAATLSKIRADRHYLKRSHLRDGEEALVAAVGEGGWERVREGVSAQLYEFEAFRDKKEE